MADRERASARRRRVRQADGRRRLDQLLRAGDPRRAVRPGPRGGRVQRRAEVPVGNREIVFPALESGEIDILAEYAATALEFVNEGAGEATTDPVATTATLRERMAAKGLTALEPAAATNQKGFVVTAETAATHGLVSISDLARPAP